MYLYSNIQCLERYEFSGLIIVHNINGKYTVKPDISGSEPIPRKGC